MTSTTQLPGLIDCHVHFREPGLEHKANFDTEALAARHGGIFTVCEMPNTIPPTNSIDRFKDKVERSLRVEKICDMRFFWGATEMQHLEELKELCTNEKYSDLRKKLSGLKLYLDNSTGDLRAETTVIEKAFELCAQLKLTLVAHCEHAKINNDFASQVQYTGPLSHSKRRPPESEETSVLEAIAFARKYKTALHIAHMSTAGGLDAVAKAKKEGLAVTCEVTPHHLFLSTDDYTVLNTRAKVNPPIRETAHCDSLWYGLLNGTVDCVATDHAPHLIEEKMDESNPPSGMPGVELVLSLLISAACGHWPNPNRPAPAHFADRRVTLSDIKEWMFTNPNKIFDLRASEEIKLDIELSEEKEDSKCCWSVKSSELHSKCKWSPYDGWVMKGRFREIKK